MGKTDRPFRGRQTAPSVRTRVGQYRIPPDVASRVRAGHPWVFRDALGPRGIAEPSGAVIDLLSGNREFVARGYVDREHAIAVRVLTRDPAERVVPGNGIVAGRFARAVQLRWVLFGAARPQTMRVFTGESEGLPGVNVDRYGDFVVVQWLSPGALAWRDEILGAIESVLAPRGIYEQRRLRPLGGTSPPEPAVRARGDEAPVELVVEDGGCRFGVDVTAPLGVGIFHDMRLGWGAVAARAAEVVAVDLAAKVHARARRNYELSGLDPARLETIAADAVKTLDRFADRKRAFDLIVCDPPTFSHGPAGQFQVARDLARLAAGSALLLSPSGFLVFATNSTKVSSAELDRALAEGGAAAGIDLRIVERVGLPQDFPVAPGFPEGNYLKVAVAARVA